MTPYSLVPNPAFALRPGRKRQSGLRVPLPLLLLGLMPALLLAVEPAAPKAPAPGTPAPLPGPSKKVDFEAQVLPIFKRNCLACHNAIDAKGELVLETPTTILKGGESGPVVVPKN